MAGSQTPLNAVSRTIFPGNSRLYGLLECPAPIFGRLAKLRGSEEAELRLPKIKSLNE